MLLSTQPYGRVLNPYQITDAECGFPSGDAFLVYPGKNGKPEESIRLMVLQEAFNDYRLFKLLESKTSKEYVMDIIVGGVEPLTFGKFPHDENYLLDVHQKIVTALKQLP